MADETKHSTPATRRKSEKAASAAPGARYRLVDLWRKQQAENPDKTIAEAMAEVLRHPHPVTPEMAERVKRRAPLNVDEKEVERAVEKLRREKDDG